jgi:hypothetical protein
VRTYEWIQPACDLEIVVFKSRSYSSILSGEVWGTRPAANIGITGRGLKLGDTIADARRIYGLRLYLGVTQSELPRRILLSDACESLDHRTSLEIGFDESGRVRHMRIPAKEQTRFPVMCW